MMLSNAPQLDTAQLAAWLDDNAPDAELRQVFGQTLEDDRKTLLHCVSKGDLEGLGKWCHRCGSALEVFGQPALDAQVEAIRASARAGAMPDVDVILRFYEELLDVLRTNPGGPVDPPG